MIAYDYVGACATPDCVNNGIMFDAPSVDGVLQNIFCGGCGVEFTDLCVPKE
jgi:hypothetical protein